MYWPCQIIIGTLRLLINRFSGAARLLFFLTTPLDLALSLDSDLQSLSSSLMCTNREKKDYSCMHTTLCCFITSRAAISPSCENPERYVSCGSYIRKEFKSYVHQTPSSTHSKTLVTDIFLTLSTPPGFFIDIRSPMVIGGTSLRQSMTFPPFQYICIKNFGVTVPSLSYAFYQDL